MSQFSQTVSQDRARLCLILSGGLVALALLMSLIGFGLNIGIDFTGGILLKYQIGEDFESAVIEKAVTDAGYGETPQVAKSGDTGTDVQIRVKDVDDPDAFRSRLEENLKAVYPGTTYLSIDRVGAVTGRGLVINAFRSVLLAAALMLAYIAIRFDLFSGMAAVFGILHDVLIMTAFMVFLRGVIQVNSTFIAACLTIVGYSINNTIVLFDRIRENLRKPGASTLPRNELVSRSVREVLGRTIGTTVTTLVAIVTLCILGVASTREFALPIIIGILAGVYSSTQINGYLWMWFQEHVKIGKAAKPGKARA